MSQNVYILDIFDGASGGSKDGSLTAGGTKTSAIQTVNTHRPLGNFAAQLKITGSGLVKVELEVTLNGTDWAISRELFYDYAAGDYVESFGMEICSQYRIKITETGGASTAVASVWLALQ